MEHRDGHDMMLDRSWEALAEHIEVFAQTLINR